MDPTDRVLSHAWLDIRDGEIVRVSSQPIPPTPEHERIDARGKVVMPGIVNAHTHLFQTLIRGVYEEMAFPDWLRAIYACGGSLTPEDSFLSAQLGCVESLRSGVTTVVEHQFLNRGEQLAEATIAGMRSAGTRVVLARTIMDLGDLAPREMLETAEQGLRSFERLWSAHESELHDGMLTLMTGPNTPGASSTGELAHATRQFAEERGIGQSMHLAESTSVLRTVRERYGHPGVVAWLESIGALGPRILAAHSVHLSADEIAIMARRGMSVSHNPVSNMFLGDGIAPIVELLAAGVNVALGTDGAASNNTQDMFEVLKMSSLLQRVRLQDGGAVPPTQALRMATINGAKALGLEDRIGSIEVGKRADLVILDLRASAHTVAVHDVVSQLVYCARASDVETVMVDGEILIAHGAPTRIDEPRLLAEAQVKGEQLVARLA
jgi:5-methylthioadenosine/S-adenosylhomocysteine deaminase